jgi:hypothetical protein
MVAAKTVNNFFIRMSLCLISIGGKR